MSLPVTIENDALQLDVWPQIGGKVSSVVDKADDFELLFNYPSELPQASQYDLPYGKSWYAGWDECFPAVSPCKYPRHPYDGISVPDHGELWGLPTTAVPTKDGITTVWHGLRFGYRLTRKLSLDGPSLLAEYTLVNLAPFEFYFVWAMHALMGMTAPLELRLDSAPGGASSFRWVFDENVNEIGTNFEWPRVADDADLSRPGTLPQRRGWKCFSNDPIASAMTVVYPGRGRSVRIEYASEEGLPAYWGIWINTGGWAGHHHLAIEPTTGRHDFVDRSMRDGSAGRVGPSGRCEWQVRWTVGAT